LIFNDETNLYLEKALIWWYLQGVEWSAECGVMKTKEDLANV